jgi:2-amino-4-hydroxy-6-hydroxymethyldihydropteridine diphosphokinase
MKTNTAVLCIGGNLGDRLENLEETRDFIEFNIGDILQASSIYESPAWGMEAAPDFLNQVVVVSTSLNHLQLLNEIKELEEFYGRTRVSGKYTSREMDVDILYLNDEVIEEEKITVPHPRLQERRFVLTPLAEILPEFIHPVLKKSSVELLKDCEDTATVKKVDSL